MVLSEALEPTMRSNWEVWDPVSLPNVSCTRQHKIPSKAPPINLTTIKTGDRPYPSPPPRFTCLICGENYTYCVQRNNSSVHRVAVTLSCDTGSTTSSSLTSRPSSTLRKSKLNLSFGCHYASFQNRSLGFQELFSNSPLSAVGHFSWGLASRLTIMCIIWSKWTRAWWSSFLLA